MELTEYLSKCVTPHQTVKTSADILKKAGFTELKADKPFNVKKGGKYFIKVYSTTLIAVTVGDKAKESDGLRIAAAHTDHPCLHIKPAAEMSHDRYMRINTEVYGGPILNTWMDRPLSIAGIAAVRSKDPFTPEIRYVDFKRPVVTIPNLPIHVNREVNKGVELNKQVDVIPILGPTDKKPATDYFKNAVADELGIDKQDLLDFDLYVYNCDTPEVIGLNKDMLSSPRLDNITSCYALLEGITGNVRNGIDVAVLFDHEEIGSHTKQGADSAMLKTMLEKLWDGLKFNRSTLSDAIFSGFLLSVDVAHAVHPSHSEKYDPVNTAFFNTGVTLKVNSNQRYTFDTSAVATVQAICDKHKIKYAKFTNRSDAVGGGTLGPIISSWIPMRTVDIGVPILAMHSARELMATSDEKELIKLIKNFF